MGHPKKWVYIFGGGEADGSADMRSLLGGKGANLSEMCKLGLPVPPGFIITTELCQAYFAGDHVYPAGFVDQIKQALARLTALTGRTLGCATKPLLLSVRAGPRHNMPGMMDAILNLGLNDETVASLAAETQNARFAYDSYRRFIQMYGDVVLGIDQSEFEDILEQVKDDREILRDTDLDAEDWKHVIEQYKALIKDELDEPFPQDVHAQLWGAIGSVFSAWMSARAITHRRLHDIPEDWGVAVNLQAMVFGNLGETSATGIAYTRSTTTGEKAIQGSLLLNAQGEDVVAGNRVPRHLTLNARLAAGADELSMEESMPALFSQFLSICELLEQHYHDMLELEFTIEGGRMWMLQVRSGKRSTKANIRIAVDLAREGLITQEEAVMRVDPRSLDELLHPTIDPSADRERIAKGMAASPGAASGHLVFTAEDAEIYASQSRNVILARTETSPEDVHGMHVAHGIVTARGGMTSHAAVVARGMGIPCVSGASMMRIDYKAETLTVGPVTLQKGDLITIDGAAGEILRGCVPMQKPEVTEDFATLMSWVDGIRRLKVRCNAETPQDARSAREFGAEGIGLCRTEHMFFQEGRIAVMREMIIANNDMDRKDALDRLLPMQREDFVALFETMAGLPVTIRLLDPPLHEFLPSESEDIANVAKSVSVPEKTVSNRIHALHEFNPMLGHRGCRIAISYPDMVEMQTRAIFEAAIEAAEKTGQPVLPEIMVPLVSIKDEFEFVKARIDATAAGVLKDAGKSIDYEVGTMIELPRAALQARKIAETAEFFSFGTNDLTQTTYGISRDDAARFISDYLRAGVVEQDPFISIDVDGVGELMEIAVERGRFSRPDLGLGICGEHGGEPDSIDFCEKIGLDYVSCSPYRVPIARLAAAQATLRRHNEG